MASTGFFESKACSLCGLPRAWSLPSGRDNFVQRLSWRPTGLTLAFALVRVALRRRVVFALALSWRRLDLGFRFCPCSGTLVFALSWQPLWVSLALLRLAPPVVARRLRACLPARVDFAPCLALRPGCQRLGLGSGGSLSLASGFDAGGSLGQGWCSTRDQQFPPPSFMRVDA